MSFADTNDIPMISFAGKKAASRRPGVLARSITVFAEPPRLTDPGSAVSTRSPVFGASWSLTKYRRPRLLSTATPKTHQLSACLMKRPDRSTTFKTPRQLGRVPPVECLEEFPSEVVEIIARLHAADAVTVGHPAEIDRHRIAGEVDTDGTSRSQ
jgi:hypothetical protein